MASVRIVGIDPGYDRLGICVLEKDNSKETLLYSTCVVTNRKDSFGKRLKVIGKEFDRVLTTYKPDELAMEKLFFAKNQTTAIQVAEVRGVILYLSELRKLSVYEYSPPEVKVAIAGHGRASKEDIGTMVPKILRLQTTQGMLDDELDAIAIALTHSAHRKVLAWKR